MHEEMKLGFVYDTCDFCILIINLNDMKPYDKCPLIESGEITNMYIDYEDNLLKF